MSYTQDHRELRLETPLGKDKLLLYAVEGTERISGLFAFTLDCYSESATLPVKDLLGKGVTVTIRDAGEGEHHTHGMVRRFSQSGRRGDLAMYRVEIVPWCWFLGLTHDVRIFQNMTVLDIVEKVFKKSPDAKYRLSCSKTYPKRDYCVQYRESDLDFVSRLLEQEGICYFFEHEKGSHTLVLTDAPSAMKSCGKARFLTTPDAKGVQDGIVLDLEADSSVGLGTVTLRDYDYLKPATQLEEKTGSRPWEHYDYPGGYSEKTQGDQLARVRLETAEAAELVVRGTSVCHAFRAGCKWTLQEHFRRDLNIEYTLLELRVSAKADNYATGDEDKPSYRNAYVAIPAKTPYRPPRTTPRPRVEGSQTAVVVGKAGEEIWVDEHGRVKVHFHWDREGKKDENSSCWVRVATSWAGKGFGAVQVPRIGEEVIVDFLEGDPDRPIVTGRVYNADRMPPYKLPDKQTQSGVLTRSSKGGSAQTANELRFEDLKGSEQVFLHAEKDLTIEVEHDRLTTVTNDDTRTVKEGNDAHEVSKGNQTVVIKQGNQDVTLNQGNQTVKLDQGNQTVTLTAGNQTVTLDQGNRTITLKMGNLETVLKVGNVTTNVNLGKHSTTALQAIEMTVGQNSIKVDQTGVTIKGMMVTIEGQTMTELKGLMTTIKGDAMLTAKGGITMIN
jgi:type VI secretion system secreted protein VgrG